MFRHIYVIKTSDKETEKQSVYPFDTKEEALTDMYNLHGVALKNTNLQATFSLVIDESGKEVERISASIPDPNKRQRYEIKPRVYWRIVKDGVEEFKIYEYATKQLAKGNLFTKYAACRGDGTCTEATIACINGDGVNLETRVWNRETDEKPAPGTPEGDQENDIS